MQKIKNTLKKLAIDIVEVDNGPNRNHDNSFIKYGNHTNVSRPIINKLKV